MTTKIRIEKLTEKKNQQIEYLWQKKLNEAKMNSDIRNARAVTDETDKIQTRKKR